MTAISRPSDGSWRVRLRGVLLHYSLLEGLCWQRGDKRERVSRHANNGQHTDSSGTRQRQRQCHDKEREGTSQSVPMHDGANEQGEVTGSGEPWCAYVYVCASVCYASTASWSSLSNVAMPAR